MNPYLKYIYGTPPGKGMLTSPATAAIPKADVELRWPGMSQGEQHDTVTPTLPEYFVDRPGTGWQVYAGKSGGGGYRPTGPTDYMKPQPVFPTPPNPMGKGNGQPSGETPSQNPVKLGRNRFPGYNLTATDSHPRVGWNPGNASRPFSHDDVLSKDRAVPYGGTQPPWGVQAPVAWGVGILADWNKPPRPMLEGVRTPGVVAHQEENYNDNLLNLTTTPRPGADIVSPRQAPTFPQWPAAIAYHGGIEGAGQPGFHPYFTNRPAPPTMSQSNTTIVGDSVDDFRRKLEGVSISPGDKGTIEIDGFGLGLAAKVGWIRDLWFSRFATGGMKVVSVNGSGANHVTVKWEVPKNGASMGAGPLLIAGVIIAVLLALGWAVRQISMTIERFSSVGGGFGGIALAALVAVAAIGLGKKVIST